MIYPSRYIKKTCFLADPLALEEASLSYKDRLWGYSYSSCRSGNIFHFSFDRKEAFQRSPSLEIFPGDMGTDVGRSIYRSIFNENTKLKLIKLPHKVQAINTKAPQPGQ